MSISDKYLKSCKSCKGVKNLKNRILLQKQETKISNSLTSASNLKKYVDKGSLWVSITTKSGIEIIEGTNTSKIKTHEFVVRFDKISKEIDRDFQIVFKDIIYQIDEIININEENKWIIIKSHPKGKNSILRNI